MVRPLFRSALVLSGLVAGTLTGAVPGAVAASTGKAAPAPTQVSRPVCTTSLEDPQQRAATFNVRMSRAPGSSSYGFNTVLEEKPAGGVWTPLKGTASPPGLGVFQPAAEGAAAMVRRINVRGLRLGSAYRLKVNFRWITAEGIQRVTRRSSACTVKEVRPNFGVIRALPWTPGTRGDQVVYRPQVRIHRFPIAWVDRRITISVNQGATVLGRVTPPLPHHGQVVLVPGNLCRPGTDVTYRIEISGSPAEESTLADNELTLPCSRARASGR